MRSFRGTSWPDSNLPSPLSDMRGNSDLEAFLRCEFVFSAVAVFIFLIEFHHFLNGYRS